MAGPNAQLTLAVAKKPLTSSSLYQMMGESMKSVSEAPVDYITVQNVEQLDGQYVILVSY